MRDACMVYLTLISWFIKLIHLTLTAFRTASGSGHAIITTKHYTVAFIQRDLIENAFVQLLRFIA